MGFEVFEPGRLSHQALESAKYVVSPSLPEKAADLLDVGTYVNAAQGVAGRGIEVLVGSGLGAIGNVIDGTAGAVGGILGNAATGVNVLGAVPIVPAPSKRAA